MNIKIATNQDRDNIQMVYLCAFPEDESEIVSKLALDLLSEKTRPQTISLIAETDGAVVAHVAFSPELIDNNENCQGYILGPLGVKPEYQKLGIGSKLMELGIQQLPVMGVNIVFVYGDPEYYSGFGFSADAAHRYIAPYKLQYPSGWQAQVLNECGGEKLSAAIIFVYSLCDLKLW